MTRDQTTRIDWQAVKDRLGAAQDALDQSSSVDESRMRDIFRRRAERLSAPTRNATSQTQSPVFVFRLGDERYGIELRHVAQVFPGTRITPVPGGPDWLAGVANLHGEVRSILDARRLLALPDAVAESNHYILLLRWEERRAGLRVEHVDGISPVATQELKPTPEEAQSEHAGCISGVTQDNLIVLRVEAIFDYGPS
jgi:purine-binding chemotaxis protein CheW